MQSTNDSTNASGPVSTEIECPQTQIPWTEMKEWLMSAIKATWWGIKYVVLSTAQAITTVVTTSFAVSTMTCTLARPALGPIVAGASRKVTQVACAHFVWNPIAVAISEMAGYAVIRYWTITYFVMCLVVVCLLMTLFKLYQLAGVIATYFKHTQC